MLSFYVLGVTLVAMYFCININLNVVRMHNSPSESVSEVHRPRGERHYKYIW